MSTDHAPSNQSHPPPTETAAAPGRDPASPRGPSAVDVQTTTPGVNALASNASTRGREFARGPPRPQGVGCVANAGGTRAPARGGGRTGVSSRVARAPDAGELAHTPATTDVALDVSTGAPPHHDGGRVSFSNVRSN